MSSRASPGGVERFAAALHAPFAARHRAFGFTPARRRRKDDVGHLAGLREEDVLHDQVLEAAQQLDRMLLVGFGLRRVLTDDVERVELAAVDRLEHLA